MFPSTLPPETTAALSSLARLAHTDMESLSFKWEAFQFAHPTASLMDASVVADFTKLILDSFNDSAAKSVSNAAMISASSTIDGQMMKRKKKRPGPEYPTSDLSTPTKDANHHRNKDFGASNETHNGNTFNNSNSHNINTPIRYSSTHALNSTPATTTNMNAATPTPSMKSSLNSTQLSTPFALRPPSHIIESLNPHLSLSSSLPTNINSSTRAAPVSIKLTRPLKQYDYKYMYEKLSLRASVLDDRIDSFALGAFSHLGTLSDPSLVSPPDTNVVAVGRIQLDDIQQSASKLTPLSCVIESSRFLGSGLRVPLRFSQNLIVSGGAGGSANGTADEHAGVALFPGIIVALKGRNGQGGWFGVDEIILPPPLPLPASTKNNQLSYSATMNRPMRLVVATGPYTLDSDLDYEPFRILLEEVRRDKPDVLILSGPFVPSTHSHLKVGNTTMSPVEIFRHKISKPLEAILRESDHMRVLLFPAVRDLIGQHFAFPQTMLDRKDKEFELHKRISCLPNPSVFHLNEVLFGVCTVDTLLHIKKEEHFFKSCSAGAASVKPDPIANLCRSILSQRNFYPVFPPPSALASEVNLDLTHLHLADLGESAPDIMITASNLKAFAKVVDSTVVVNPGFFTKGSSAGTFARMVIAPPSFDSQTQMEDVLEHKLYDRCKVELVKL